MKFGPQQRPYMYGQGVQRKAEDHLPAAIGRRARVISESAYNTYRVRETRQGFVGP